MTLLLVNEYGDETSLWTKQTSASNWTHTNVHVGQRGKSYSLKFAATFSINHNVRTQIGIDDIAFVDCSMPVNKNSSVNCDFESDLCAWYPEVDDSSSSTGLWMRQNGIAASSDQGPLTDHTLMSPAGSYAFVPINQTGRLSKLISAPVQSLSTAACFSFYYHMRGMHTQSLILFQRSADVEQSDDTLLWAQGYSQGNDWFAVSVPMSTTETFEVHLIEQLFPLLTSFRLSDQKFPGIFRKIKKLRILVNSIGLM